jgi:GTPase SAR1 family protein
MDISTQRTLRHKVVMVGDVAVGKTSIINRIKDDTFNEIYDVKIYIFNTAIDRS